MSREEIIVRDGNDNIVSRVSNVYGNLYVEVQGEGDHPLTRRARARKALREALGADHDVLEYLGAVMMTHVSSKGEVYGSLHRYSAVKIG